MLFKSVMETFFFIILNEHRDIFFYDGKFSPATIYFFSFVFFSGLDFIANSGSSSSSHRLLDSL